MVGGGGRGKRKTDNGVVRKEGRKEKKKKEFTELNITDQVKV